jgi:hypothetical protein
MESAAEERNLHQRTILGKTPVVYVDDDGEGVGALLSWVLGGSALLLFIGAVIGACLMFLSR